MRFFYQLEIPEIKLVSEPDGSTDPRAEARRLIDAAAAEVQGETDLDHRELAEVLLKARDTLLVTGRVPDWFGDADVGRYAEMVRD